MPKDCWAWHRAAHGERRTRSVCAIAKCSPTAAICWPSCIAGRTTIACSTSVSDLAQQAGLPLVAANDVHFHHPSRRALADVLTATRAGCTVAEAGELLFPNAARHLKSPDEMRELFARVPEAVRRSVEIAERCTFSLDELRYEYPEELAPPGQTPLEYLTRLTWAGASGRYPGGVPEKVRSCSSTSCN